MTQTDSSRPLPLGMVDLAKGIAAYNNGWHQTAARHFKEAVFIGKNPEAVNYLYILGMYYLFSEDYLTALELLGIASKNGHNQGSKIPFDHIVRHVFELACNAFANGESKIAHSYFTFLHEHPRSLTDEQQNVVLFYFGLYALQVCARHLKTDTVIASHHFKVAFSYFRKASIRMHRPSFEVSIKMLIPYVEFDLENKKERLWNRIRAEAGRCIPEHQSISAGDNDIVIPKNTSQQSNLEYAESLQKTYELEMLRRRVTPNDKKKSQDTIIKQFKRIPSSEYLNRLFTLLLNDAHFLILNQHAHPWIDWFLGITYTSSYCLMIQRIRSAAQKILSRELKELTSTKDKKKLLEAARQMKLFSFSTDNHLFFRQPTDELRFINRKLANITAEEEKAPRIQPRGA